VRAVVLKCRLPWSVDLAEGLGCCEGWAWIATGQVTSGGHVVDRGVAPRLPLDARLSLLVPRDCRLAGDVNPSLPALDGLGLPARGRLGDHTQRARHGDAAVVDAAPIRDAAQCVGPTTQRQEHRD